MSMMLIPYPGYAPSNVSKEAKYSIKYGGTGMEVHLLYSVGPRECELLATAHHTQLVAMVNAVKEEANGSPGGAFYINEFKDVIVPSTGGVAYFAGNYDPVLEFNLDGTTISAKAPANTRPGDPWTGPRHGVPYQLAAGGNDIYYKFRRGSRETKYLLSDYHGGARSSELARRLAAIKGTQGGRIYINEHCEFFDPATIVYLGSLGDDPWFPPPDVPGRE